MMYGVVREWFKKILYLLNFFFRKIVYFVIYDINKLIFFIFYLKKSEC